jgi:uncharacterized alpha-E superfamily protein
MLSRVAENIYWMARYLERAEDMARLIHVNASLVLDLPKGLSPIWSQLIAITGAEPAYNSSDYDERSVLKFLISDTSSPVSIVSCLFAARENARTIRDVIPREVWETINTTYLKAKESAPHAITRRNRFAFLADVICECQTITGILAGTMNHDAGYTFLRIGRNLERADMTSRIIDIRSANLLPGVGEAKVDAKATYDNLQWMSVLKSMSGYHMYRRQMQIRVRRQDVLRFLIQSDIFPRAISHCIREVQTSVLHLHNHEKVQLVIMRIKRQLENDDIAQLQQADLAQYIDNLQIGFGQLHDELTKIYFSGEVQSASQAA